MRRILMPVLMLCAVALPASGKDGVCQDPASLCAEQLSDDCVDRIGAGLVGSFAPPGECGQQYEEFRACVAAASRCASDAASKNGGSAEDEAAAAASLVDPALVGVWRMMVPSADGGLLRWQLEIAADGAYVFAADDPALKSAVGVFRAADGRWSIRTGDWEDSGMYRIPTTDTVIFVGQAGAQIWSRVDPDG